MTAQKKQRRKFKEYCHECQIKRGGVVPKQGQDGITVHGGYCSGCKQNDKTIVSTVDYDWPKEGKKAIWD